jgi:hypothetical protein
MSISLTLAYLKVVVARLALLRFFLKAILYFSRLLVSYNKVELNNYKEAYKKAYKDVDTTLVAIVSLFLLLFLIIA